MSGHASIITCLIRLNHVSCLTTIGVIGAGQLARMMYAPSVCLGLNLHLLAETPDSSAARVFSTVHVGDYNTPGVVSDFAHSVQAITFDHEHVPTSLLTQLQSEGVIVRPEPQALRYAQDKYLLRADLGARLHIPAPAWRRCDTPEQLCAFADAHSWPIIAKASRGGYDGHGVWKINSPDEATIPFAESLGYSAGEQVVIIAEEFIDFVRELSILVARNPQGQIVTYPVSQTVQRDGICVETITPAPDLDLQTASQITQLATRIADDISVVGILAVELMQRRDGSVVVNELAMRPHNTGHWTINGSMTSQFENHLRAVAGLGLGSTRMSVPNAVMVNILGGSLSNLHSALPRVLEDERIHVELYGKQPRPGRKIGHVVCCGSDWRQARKRAQAAARRLTDGE